MNVYQFRSGHSIRSINPQAVGQELERLRKVRGKLTPADVLEEAASPDSPFHGAFEWDDSLAAQQHRLSQARRLIVSVRVINEPAQVSVPAFVSVRTPDKGREYVPTAEAMSDESLRARVLLEIRQFAEGLERRYAQFKEVGDILSRMRSAAG